MAKKKETAPEKMTVEGLIALGFDKETAEAMVQTTDDGGGLPAPLLKFNYDKEDVLSDLGIKKGNLISGYKIDRQKLEVKETGEDLGSTIEFVIVSSVYQNSAYDIKTNQTSVASNIFNSPYGSKQSYDLKTGTLIQDLKKSNDKIKFNNILTLLIKRGTEWKPYMFYLRGTAYFKWNEQLSNLGISRDASVNQYTFTVSTKKVPTTQQPAWILNIDSAKARSVAELVELKDEISPAIKATAKWVNTVNSRTAGNYSTATTQPEAPAPGSNDVPEIDIDEDDIQF